jgi:hypothetical protein
LEKNKMVNLHLPKISPFKRQPFGQYAAPVTGPREEKHF